MKTTRPLKYNRRLRQTSLALLNQIAGMLDERSSFAPFDKEKDAAVKEAISLYVRSWLLPSATALKQELWEENKITIDTH